MAMAFRVKLVTDGCLHILSMLVCIRSEGEQVPSKSGGLSLCFSERFVSLFFGATCVFSVCPAGRL